MSTKKINNLDYNPNWSSVKERTVKGVPKIDKYPPRTDMLLVKSMIDPSGSGLIEPAYTGLEGQGFGLASYKKGVLN